MVPEHTIKWCYGADDWEAPHAENDGGGGGKFKTVMAAEDINPEDMQRAGGQAILDNSRKYVESNKNN